jgi:hypothetical protein
MGQIWLDGYSAAIEIYLIIGGQKHDVAQIGGGSLILRHAVKIPPMTNAKLVVKIDGREEVEQVLITDGATCNREPVSFF